MTRIRGGTVALGFACACAAIFATAPAYGAHPLRTGLGEVAGTWGFNHAKGTNARIVKGMVSWASVAPQRPANPRSPSDPAYNWGGVDGFVRQASRRGLDVLLAISRAPSWAEGRGSKRAQYNGTWKPNAAAFGDFAHALARRYSGSSRPRVRYFEIWPEANRTPALEPQWQHGKPKSPKIYKRLANAAYKGIKSVHGGDRIIGPGLAPYGDARNRPATAGIRMRPVYFLRQLFCLKDRHKLKRKKHCRHPVKLDAVSHHPINSSGAPTRHAINPDDASSADLHRITRVVHAAQRKGTIVPRHKHRKLWATETWWESKPPSHRGVPPPKQARWLEKALYIYWRDGASVVIQQPLRDRTVPGPGRGGGLFFTDGRAKPAYRAFRFPFVTKRTSKRHISAWGKAPKRGKLKIQRKRHRHGWKTIKRRPVRKNQVFKARVRLRGDAKLRAKVGSSKSLVWRQG